jgi:CRISPR/Cas system-associated exonuclease Cas4 (RecB family)
VRPFRNLSVTLALVVLLALAAGFAVYRLSVDPVLHEVARKRDTLQWLRTDFHLDDRQFAEIRRLHEAYAGSCEEHCRMIREAAKLRDQLAAADRADPFAVAAANRRLQELRSLCESAITRHVREVAALMAPEDGRRYLALVLPKISDFDHTAAPDLRLNHSS